MVDPSKVSLQSVKSVVGEEHADLIGVVLEVGKLTHPLQVRRPLGIEELAGMYLVAAPAAGRSGALKHCCRAGSE